MSDEEIRRLERLVETGDAAALDRLVGELERLGRFEGLLAAAHALLNGVQHRQLDGGRTLATPLRPFDVVEAIRRLLGPRAPGWVLAFREVGESLHQTRVIGYVAATLVEGRVELGTGCSDPRALMTFRTELEQRGGNEPERVFEVARAATLAAARDEHLRLSHTLARAWARWCEADPRTQPHELHADHVRLRPAMYIGDTGAHGLHQLVHECLDDVIQDFATGHLARTMVTIGADGSLAVHDDGPGLLVKARNPDEPSPLEIGFTRLVAPGVSREERAYGAFPGLLGVGTACVNYLSAWFEVETVRDGELWDCRFEQGNVTRRATCHGTTRRRGTAIRFLPDRAIFTTAQLDFDTIARRLEELAYVFPGLDLALEDLRDRRRVEYRFERGLAELVERFGASRPVFVVSGSADSPGSGGTVRVDVALGWGAAATNVQSFVNGARTEEHGTHVDGLMASLSRSFDGGRREARVGLVAAIALRVPEPQFLGSTRTKLGNPELSELVASIVTPALRRYLASRA